MFKNKFNYLFVLLAVFWAPFYLLASAASSTLIPRDVLFGNPEKASPKISPDGRYLAYLAPDDHDVLNIWVRPLNSLVEQDIKITSDKKQGIRSFMWQFDNEHLLYIQDEGGNENHHLFQTSIATAETKDLTPFPDVKVKILDYDSKFPEECLVEMNRRDKTCFDVYRLNLKSGQCELDTENQGGYFESGVDHQLQVRLAVAFDAEGNKIAFIRNDRESPFVEWLKINPFDDVVLGDFTADDRSIYLLTNQNSNTMRLVEANLETKVQKTIWENPKYDISTLSLNPLTHTLESVGIATDKYEQAFFDEKKAQDFHFLERKLNSLVSCVSRDLNDRYWIVGEISSHKVPRYYLFDRSLKKIDFLFSAQTGFEKYTFSPMEPVTFQARDGMQLYGYLTYPPTTEEQNQEMLPAVLLVHGGPALRDLWELNPRVQWLANRGYVVLQINYRGSKGYGKDYLNAGNREWGAKMQTDLLDGKNWLVREKIADPARVAIMGGSYGGYATLAGLTFHPDEYCCGVDICGVSSLISFLKSMPPYWKPALSLFKRRFGTLDDEEFLKSRSPFYFIDKIVKPLLIGQGANDPRVKQAESDQIVHAMRERKIPVEYILFPDEGHGFSRPENQLIFYAAAEDFLFKYLGGKREPPKPEEDWTPFMK